MSIEMNDEHEQSSEIRYLGDVQRLQLQPGDVVVVTVPGVLSYSQFLAVEAHFQQRLPDHTVLVLERGASVSVMNTPGVDHGKD